MRLPALQFSKEKVLLLLYVVQRVSHVDPFLVTQWFNHMDHATLEKAVKASTFKIYHKIHPSIHLVYYFG
jgi:hypothetical protein